MACCRALIVSCELCIFMNANYNANLFVNTFIILLIKILIIFQLIKMDEPIITEENPKPFIVRVKLLTNEVYEFQVDKEMKVADFKTLISPKVQVPVDRMRMVFAGKQLVDDKPLSTYVEQSGMTVHLIARTTPAPESNQPAQNVPPVNNQHQSQPPPNMPPNPFGDIMGMMGSIFGGQQPGGPPQITMSFGTGNNPLGGLLSSLGGLGVRIPPPPEQANNQPPPAQSVQPQSQPQSQPQPQPQSQNQSRISYTEIGQLNQSLNTLNIPLDSVTTQNETMTPEGVITYLRRLHHQGSRSMLQLNRLLNIAEADNNNVGLLERFIPVFQSLNAANTVAIGCLNQMRNRNTNQQSQQPTVLSNSTPTQQSTSPIGREIPQVQNRPPATQSQQPQPHQHHHDHHQHQHQHQHPHQHQHQHHHPQPQPQPQQFQMQMPIPQQGGNLQQGFNPLQMIQGLDIGSLMGGLSSVGGVNGLFGMSLREMMSENGEQPQGIFIDIFGGMTGQNMMQMFTTKDFKFLNDKHNEIRTNLKKRINETNEQAVIKEIVKESSSILVPTQPHPMIRDLKSCQQKCNKNLEKHVKKLVEISLAENNPEYYVKATEIGKRAFCQNVHIIIEHTASNNENVAFQIIKIQTLRAIEPILPGISGLFYSLIERDLVRIYQEFKVDEERRKQMSAEESQSEQKLIEMIKEAGSKDSEYLANVQHSQSYFQ